MAKLKGRKPKIVRRLTDREIATVRQLENEIVKMRAALEGMLVAIRAGAPEGAFISFADGAVYDRDPRPAPAPRPRATEPAPEDRAEALAETLGDVADKKIPEDV